jgi:uncharacterized repeat protein (TIGR03917 family)
MNDLGEFVPGLPALTTSTPTPLAAVTTVHDGVLVEYEVALVDGATAADLTTAMISVPPSAALVRHQDSRKLSLVFRELPADTPYPDAVGLRS